LVKLTQVLSVSYFSEIVIVTNQGFLSCHCERSEAISIIELQRCEIATSLCSSQ
jgi:hypothetical protein